MSKQWNHGFHTGKEQGVDYGITVGKHIGEAETQMGIVMRCLCLAHAIRDAQKNDCVSQYVLTELLIDICAEQTGGRLDVKTQQIEKVDI